MGSPPDQQPTTPAKPPNSKTPPAPALAAPPSTAQELPATPPYPAEWAAAAAFYGQAGAAGAPTIFQPWVGQHLVAPYGTPIAYPPMYHPAAAAMYAHPSMAAAAVAAYPAPESGNGSKSKKGSGRSGDGGGKVTSGSAEEDGSQSGGSSEGEGSSDTRDDSADPQDASRKRSFNDSFGEGETSQPIAGAQNTAESAYSGRARTAAKLPVSAPGRAALPGPAPNLNIGMELWSTSHATTAPVNVRPNSVKIASSTAGANGVIPEQQFLQQDERELKRERRKQSNRESARRSRLRKQQECEDLAKKVSELTGENKSLRLELEQLTNVCKDLEADNASIMEELNRMHGAGLAPEFEGIKHNSLSKPSVGSEGSGQIPQNPVGSNGKIHSSGGNF